MKKYDEGKVILLFMAIWDYFKSNACTMDVDNTIGRFINTKPIEQIFIYEFINLLFDKDFDFNSLKLEDIWNKELMDLAGKYGLKLVIRIERSNTRLLIEDAYDITKHIPLLYILESD